MRGMDRRSGELFSYVDLEKRVRPDHPLRAIRSISDEALEMLSEDFRDLYSGMESAFGRAGEAAPGDAVAGVSLDPLGAPIDGAP